MHVNDNPVDANNLNSNINCLSRMPINACQENLLVIFDDVRFQEKGMTLF